MKILDLPIDQIEWLISEFKDIKSNASKMGFVETVSLLDKGKLMCNLLKEENFQ